MWPSQRLGRDGMERVIFLAEVRQVVHLGRGDEPAGEVVGPGVVGAADQAREAPLIRLAEPRAAVAADVVEGADRHPSSARVTITLSPATSRST